MGCPESGQSVYAAVCSNQSEAVDVFRGGSELQLL